MRTDTKQSALRDLDEGDGTFDVREIWNVLRAKAWLIISLGIIGALVGYAYLRLTPHFYFAQAVIQIDFQEARVVDFQEARSPDLASLDMLDTIAATFRSRTFLKEVIESNNLLSDPDFLPPSLDGKPHSFEDGVNALL